MPCSLITCAMDIFISRIFMRRSPSQVVRVDASFMSIAAGVGSMVLGRWRFPVRKNAHLARCAGIPPIDHDIATARSRFGKRPNETRHFIGVTGMGPQPFHRLAGVGSCGGSGSAMVPQSCVVLYAKPATMSVVAASINCAYQSLSHFSLLERLISVRATGVVRDPSSPSIIQHFQGFVQWR